MPEIGRAAWPARVVQMTRYFGFEEQGNSPNAQKLPSFPGFPQPEIQPVEAGVNREGADALKLAELPGLLELLK